MLAGVLGMATKFVECTLAVKFRNHNADGSVSGGPMYFLEKGIGERYGRWVGKGIGGLYALGIVIGCLGIGNMFQSNQAFVQFANVMEAQQLGWLAERGWLFGIGLAVLVASVIIGGISIIARVTEVLVPFMAGLYVIGAGATIALNYAVLPAAIEAILAGALEPEGVAGGALGVMVIGIQRAVFSNEAGIGSAAIAHSAVRTGEPVTEGLVSLLEPFIDTVVICTLTSLVIVTTMVAEPGIFPPGVGGIEMTSTAFQRMASWAPYPLPLVAALFASSTMITWSYYGLKGWTYLVGEGRAAELGFNAVFCAFVVLGATIQIGSVLDLSDALIFVVCVPNLLGLYLLAPLVKWELASYESRVRSGEIRNYRAERTARDAR
jgi:AGCS family alanine or glycine:cation symporter